MKLPVSPAPGPFKLALRHAGTGKLLSKGPLLGGEPYGLVLIPAQAPLERSAGWYGYVVLIDASGEGATLFPRVGETAQLLGATPGSEWSLGPAHLFSVSPPYGTDTYHLLTVREPLPDPARLLAGGLRRHDRTLLGRASLAAHLRNAVTGSWFLETFTFQSIGPR